MLLHAKDIQGPYLFLRNGVWRWDRFIMKKEAKIGGDGEEVEKGVDGPFEFSTEEMAIVTGQSLMATTGLKARVIAEPVR